MRTNTIGQFFDQLLYIEIVCMMRYDAKHYIQTVYKFIFNGCFLNASYKT